VTEAAFEAILGQLNSLDSLFDSVDDSVVDRSPPGCLGVTAGPTPPRSAAHHAQSNADPDRHQAVSGCDDVLRGALLELNAIAANSAPPAVDCVSATATTTTSTVQQNAPTHTAAAGLCSSLATC